MSTKTHYLEGVTHVGQLDGRQVLTTWLTKKGDASKKVLEFKAQGADFTRIFTDGRLGYRVVGYWR